MFYCFVSTIQIEFSLILNQNQLMDKEAIPKTRGYKKQTKNPPRAPAGDAVAGSRFPA